MKMKIFTKALRFSIAAFGLATKIMPKTLAISLVTEGLLWGLDTLNQYANSKSKKAKKATDKMIDITLICAKHLAKNSETDYDDQLVKNIEAKRK
jgi:hypothetical protein